MTGPESRTRAPYVTERSRAGEIRELFGRGPTANEVRALAELPLEKYQIHLDDNSENGRRILQLLRQSEQNRDVSLLEKAGELLMEQSTRLPPHWQSPAPRRLLLNDLPDDVYQFSSMSNDPFAKVGSVKIVESRALPRAIPALNEPQHTTYPDLLTNPRERWLRKSSNNPQPMRLIPPIPLSNSYSRLDQQVQRQIAQRPTSGKQMIPYASIKPNPAKAFNSYRVHKNTANTKPKSKATRKPSSDLQIGGSQRIQGLSEQTVPLINPNLSIPKWQEGYFSVPPTGTPSHPQIKTASSRGPHSSNGNQTPKALPISTHPTTKPGGIPNLSQNQFSAPSTSAMTTPNTHSAMRPIANQQPHNATSYESFSSRPPAIRTPTTPLAPRAQGDLPWLETKASQNKPVTAAAEPTETKPYDEVYRLAKETADNLAKMLVEQ